MFETLIQQLVANIESGEPLRADWDTIADHDLHDIVKAVSKKTDHLIAGDVVDDRLIPVGYHPMGQYPGWVEVHGWLVDADLGYGPCYL